MEIGMEQLVWAIIFLVFIIITALKNRGRKKPGAATGRTGEGEERLKGREATLGRYLENIFGVELPKEKPQIRVEEETPKPSKKRVRQKPERKEERIGEFTTPLIKKFEEAEKLLVREKKEIYHAKFPWNFLTKKDLKSAIILSEIIGPPISKRKGHRLF